MNTKWLIAGLALTQSAAWAGNMLTGGLEGWSLNQGRGEKTGNVLMVEGDGKSDNAWLSKPLTFEAGATYRLRFRARSEGASGGTVTSGIPAVNVDIGVPGETWTEYSHVFVVPGARWKKVEMPVRLGQWIVKGKVFFEDVRVVCVSPLYAVRGSTVLGEGERMDGTAYTFSAPFNAECRNHSRPFEEATATYNSNRWCLGDGTYFTYRHWFLLRPLRSARLEITSGYHQSGRAVVEVSKEGGEWQEIAVLDKVGSVSVELPPPLFPADGVLVRVRGEGKGCSLQIHSYTFTAEVAPGFVGTTPYEEPLAAVGATPYFEITASNPDTLVQLVSIGAMAPGGRNEVCLARKNSLETFATVVFEGKGYAPTNRVAVEAGLPFTNIPYDLPGSGDWDMYITVGDVFEAHTKITIPVLYDGGYGELLPCVGEGLALWRAPSGWKIPKGRGLPKAKADALEVWLAKGEWEAVQLVVAPKWWLPDVKVRVEGLEEFGVEVLRVGYVPVAQRTDPTGVLADWPDPLLPQAGACPVAKGENQPFWIRVHAPKGARAGLHRGTVVVEALAVSERVPLNVGVYNFALPDTMTCETAFGFNPQTVWRYHNVRDEAQRREVLGKYLRALADHRISVYDPAPMDGWSVSWTGMPPWEGGRVGDGMLTVRDESATASPSAAYKEHFRVPGKGVKITATYRTEGTPDTLLALNHYRADGSWISGHNRSVRLPAAAEWATREETVAAFPEGAASFRLYVYGAGWQEEGGQTGATHVKALSVVDLATGRELVAPTAFAAFDAAKAEPVFDWARWDAAMAYAFTNYHFNSFQMHVEGLGGGTFHARYEPQFMGFAEDTPEYHALLGKYLGGIEAHLNAKGWLGKAYAYWFDEPDEKDYAFVMGGFGKLKKYAPGLRRMLTEQAEEGLAGGPNLWCPLTPSLNVPLLASRRAAGDSFWWYICCGPRAPYVTEFIDHPGTELRLWLWQTWQERVSGILIWETVWWTSGAAYPSPDAPQNPYLDPMSWESGYDAKPGMKQPWGNGDGRFLYPPLAAAGGRPAGPVLDAPVDSYRLEMLRDGIEDYEYFVILKKLLAEKKGQLPAARHAEYEALLTVPPEVSASLTSFTHDPAPMECHRERLARAIEDVLK